MSKREARPLWKILLGNFLLGKSCKKPMQWFGSKGKPNCVRCREALQEHEIRENATVQSCNTCRKEVEAELAKEGKWIWRDILRETISSGEYGEERIEVLEPLLDLMDEQHAEAMFSVVVDRQKKLTSKMKSVRKAARK